MGLLLTQGSILDSGPRVSPQMQLDRGWQTNAFRLTIAHGPFLSAMFHWNTVTAIGSCVVNGNFCATRAELTGHQTDGTAHDGDNMHSLSTLHQVTFLQTGSSYGSFLKQESQQGGQ